MREFDLSAAKAGAPVCTRDGMEARIICFDRVDLEYPIIALYKTELGIEHMRSFSPNGLQFDGVISDEDLMMRDDDYAEKLARGEYGKHIDEATEKVDPTIKENLTVDRERLRRELSEKIMVAMIRELAGKSPHSTSSNITVFEAMAADAVSYADALLEELDKKK
mgnify:FL=1|jgi:hypothetical protein